jgi:hypothetical protein
MCDIYMTSYLDCEPAVISEINCIRELIESGAKSAVASGDDSNAKNLLPQCTNESITSLLGGALKVILDCRFALTEAVVGRYVEEMTGLSALVVRHLQHLILKVLRILVLLPTLEDASVVANTPSSSSSSSSSSSPLSLVQGREECVAVLKAQYSLLLALSSAGTGAAGAAGASSGSGSGSGTDGAGEEEKKSSVTAEACQTLYCILERLNSVVFLKQFLLIN